MDEIAAPVPAVPETSPAPRIYTPQYQCRLCAEPLSFLFDHLLATHLREVHRVYQLSPDVMKVHMPHEPDPMPAPPEEPEKPDHPEHPHGTPPGQDPDFVPPGHGGTPPGQEPPAPDPSPEHPIVLPDPPTPAHPIILPDDETDDDEEEPQPA